MDPKDAISLFLSIEALLLAGATVGVTIVRTKKTSEDVAYAKALATHCFYLSVALSVGAGLAWLDAFARCDTIRGTASDVLLDIGQSAALAAAIIALPFIAEKVARGAK